jgi:hypothetical protein
MANKPDKPEQVTPPKITVTDAGIAPFVFFEGAPNFGFVNGVVNVTLAASRHLIKDGAVVSDIVAVAHLRCNIPAALELRGALDRRPLARNQNGGCSALNISWSHTVPKSG